jgi:hypothetical protein
VSGPKPLEGGAMHKQPTNNSTVETIESLSLVQDLEVELVRDGRFASKLQKVSKLRELRSYSYAELSIRDFLRMLLPHATPVRPRR